jgi:hypothetical protein
MKLHHSVVAESGSVYNGSLGNALTARALGPDHKLALMDLA